MTFETLFKTCGPDVKNCKIKNKIDFLAYSHIYMSCYWAVRHGWKCAL